MGNGIGSENEKICGNEAEFDGACEGGLFDLTVFSVNLQQRRKKRKKQGMGVCYNETVSIFLGNSEERRRLLCFIVTARPAVGIFVVYRPRGRLL